MRVIDLLRQGVARAFAASWSSPRSPRAYGVVGPLTSPLRPPSPMSWLELRMREGGMGGADAAGDQGAPFVLRVGGAAAPGRCQRGGGVQRGTPVGERSGRARCQRAGPEASRATSTPTSIMFQQRGEQRLSAAAPGGERPARLRVTVPRWGEQPGDRAARRLGECGGAAGASGASTAWRARSGRRIFPLPSGCQPV
jgi:hypothetical protein